MKKLIAFISCIVLFLAASSCSYQQISETGSDRTVIRMAMPKNVEDIKSLINAFETENPTVKIEKVDMPRSSAERHSLYVSAMSSGDSSIDLYWLDDGWIEEFVRYKYLEPLSDRIRLDESIYITDSYDVFSCGGQLYALPLAIDIDFIFYRKDIIKETPSEWTDIHKFIDSGDGILGFCMNNEISEDMIYDIIELKESMNCSYEETLEFYKKIMDSSVLEDDIGYISPFKIGNALFLKDCCSEWVELNEDISAVRGNVGAVVLPDGTGKHFINEYGLGINARSENKEYAKKFLEYLSISDNQRLLAREYGLMPVIADFYDDEMVLDINPHFYGVKEIVKNAIHYSDLDISGEAVVEIENLLKDYFNGKTDAKTVSDAFKRVYGG